MASAADFRGKRVTVLGLGIEGVDLVRFLCAAGAEVTVSDAKTADQLHRRLQEIAGRPVRLSLGANRAEDAVSADMLFVSQGVPLTIPAVAEARRRGVAVSSMMRLFLELCPGTVVGITGSSGKTTTTSLVGAMFAAAGRRHVVGGNIGVGLLSHIQAVTADTWVILEISHTQLELLERSPHVACITNVTPNHLDHYTWQEYVDLKARILRYQSPADYAVINADDVEARHLAADARGQVVYFSGRGAIEGEGASVEDGHFIWHSQGQRLDILPIEEIPLRGAHNVENVAAAAAVASLCGIPPAAIRQAVRHFPGVPHRLEIVARVNGVTYCNDSIATTPERTLAALRSFAEPIVLLLGGRHKQLPLEELAGEATRRCRAVICFGEAGPLLHEAVRRAASDGPSLILAPTLAQAVGAARQAAQPGDLVLLSPACTSFDAYNNFEERGQEFRDLVAQMVTLEVRP